MTRLLIILIIIFILLTIARNIFKKAMVRSSLNNPDKNPEIKKDKESGTGDKNNNIIDAKFEEIK